MNTNKLYIASLRVAVTRVSMSFLRDCITHRHLEYVLVESKDMEVFKDLKTGETYRRYFGSRDKAIDLDEMAPFNEVINNRKKYITKRKALTLFEQKVEEWRSKK